MELTVHWMADILPLMPEKEFEELKNDIEGLGQLEPILVFNGEILDGRHRYKACQELGIEPWVREFEGGMALSDVVRSLNVYRRHLTASQRAMVAAELIKPYEEHARANQIEAGIENKKNLTNQKARLVVNLPQAEKKTDPEIIDITPPKETTQSLKATDMVIGITPTKKNPRSPAATDMAAKDWGVSGKSVRDAKVIIEKGTNEEKDAVKSGKSTVSSTAKKIRADKNKKKEPDVKKQSVKKMNYTNDNIKWAKWTWNPVTGCLHGCPYCYAMDIAKRHDKHFDPTMHEDRLSAPENTKIPESKKDIFGIDKVFVCSMADLFGAWVHPEWIQAVIDVCNEQKQWTYLFLTKNPDRYSEFTFPDNCWIGASATNQKQYDTAITAFKMFKQKNIKFLSFEPLNSEIKTCNDFGGIIDWVIIGGRSKTTGMPAFQPEWAWVEHIFSAARAGGVAVYFKDNLTAKPEEYPE